MVREKLRTFRCGDELYEASMARAKLEGRPLAAAVRWLLAEWTAIDDRVYLAALRKAKAEGTTLGAVLRELLVDWVQPTSIRQHPGRRRTDSGPRGDQPKGRT